MNLLFKCFQRRNWLIGSLALLMGLGWSQVVRAEGSKDLITNGGNRPFLDYRLGTNDNTDDLAGIPRRNVIKVYAQAGETINLASSALGIGNGRIYFYDPNSIGYNPVNPNLGQATGFCGSGGLPGGLIPNLTSEQAGSYTPCQVTVGAGQTGVWEIVFTSPVPANAGNPPITSVGSNWTQPANVSYIAAWDVTVKSGTAPVPGRVYANYLPLNMGPNVNNQVGALYSKTYILTDKGYQYQIALNGIDPFGFIFFANNKGFTTQPEGGEPLYQSVPFSSGNASNPLYPPNQPDKGTDVTHKIFFNQPSPDLPTQAKTPETTTWLLRDPESPAVISNLRFEGRNQGTLNETGFGTGGNFIFESTQGKPGYYAITIKDSNGTILRVLRGRINDALGVTTVEWNGNDERGRPVNAGYIPYTSELTIFAGDVHFPFLDPENNPRGIIIQRLNSTTNVTADPSLVFFDDSAVGGTNQLGGISSQSGAHAFTNNFGDRKGIDTWTSLLGPIRLQGGILIRQADIKVEKGDTPDPVIAGNQLTYSIKVSSVQRPNVTPVQGIVVTDTVPSILTGVTWTCSITNDAAPQPGDPNPIQNRCGTASGTGNDINLTLDLNIGAEATITVIGAVSPIAVGQINNTAQATPPPGVPDPDPSNNNDSEPTTVQPGPIQPAGVKSVRIFEDKDSSGTPTTGDVVEYTVTYANQSAQDITNFRATDPIESDKLDFAGGYSFTASGARTTITSNSNYNGTTDTKLNTIGTLGANGGQIEVKYRAVIKAPAGTTISNQAVATFDGGTVNPSVSQAVDGTGLLPQPTDDGINQGNFPRTDDDNPTIIKVGGNTAGSSLRLLKRITNITRNGIQIGGINFGSFTDDPNDNNDTAPGWSQLPGSSPVGVFDIGTEASLQSGDDVEYTVYFLADGTQPAQSIKVCDPIPEGTIFTPGSISVTLPSAGLSNSTQTDAADSDRGSFIPSLNVTSPYSSPPCPNPNNPTGAVFVDLGDIPNTAPNNVGFVRFRARIK